MKYLTRLVLSGLEPLRGSERAASRIARSVAFAIGIALSMQPTALGQGSQMPYWNIHSLADYQLTEKQEYCHNQITFRESSNRIDAVNKYKTAFGYYQLKNKIVKDAPYDVQFYYYWKYVSHRYGVTEYDEPNYCKALNHLIRKGWQ